MMVAGICQSRWNSLGAEPSESKVRRREVVPPEKVQVDGENRGCGSSGKQDEKE